MAASKPEIDGWFDEGVKKGATHMIVVCDDFDYDDYPKYVMPGEDVREKSTNLGNMQRLMEVYNLSMDKAAQMAQRRVFNY
jgi:hypothetical protein